MRRESEGGGSPPQLNTQARQATQASQAKPGLDPPWSGLGLAVPQLVPALAAVKKSSKIRDLKFFALLGPVKKS